jgi:hypothetical protein
MRGCANPTERAAYSVSSGHQVDGAETSGGRDGPTAMP